MITADVSAVKWRKASRSDHHGGECVEVGSIPWVPVANWRKSSHSDHHGGDCVEVAEISPLVAVRDSRDPDGPKLAFGAAEWRAFTHRIKDEQYR
ncbi:DUF397 domain-containing protein [Actinomadura sp. BRA 177]|uniref:DUF397 domain-containing protein n=1 Tax=Actinomadura sp. BRA 177 TaxID=2745202 RepID=UPI0015954F6A|nr:DUF397 domain-containing protein [Actinomadura sp. BRA 177]NVI88515.1 DUF397 domain-containing protein [Actinomadura sp. BRA 177]